MAQESPSRPGGRVFDIGYQRYTGPREGRFNARRAIFIDSIKVSLGLGRGGWAKFVPWLFIAPAMLVGLGFAVLAAFADQTLGESGLEDELNLPSHFDLLNATGIITMLFAAVMGSELMCPDRKQRVMHLYLVRPMTLLDYLASKYCAFFIVMVGVLLIPQLALLIGTMFGVDSLTGYFQDNWVVIPKFIGGALVIGIFSTSFVFLASSLTDRRMVAALIAIGFLLIVSAMLGILSEAGISETLFDWLQLLNPLSLSFGTVSGIIFNEPDSDSSLNRAIPLIWYAILIVGFTVATWRIYQSKR